MSKLRTKGVDEYHLRGPSVEREPQLLDRNHERVLIGRRCLVHDLVLVDLVAFRDDGVANRKQRQPFADDRGRRVPAGQVVEKSRVAKLVVIALGLCVRCRQRANEKQTERQQGIMARGGRGQLAMFRE